MRPLVAVIFLVLSHLSYAQFLEFGGSAGIFNYSGDLNSYPRISHSNFALQGIYAMNFSEIVSLKMGLAFGSVSGDDQEPVDALARERAYEFKHRIVELSASFEYYFLNFKSEKSFVNWSPYIFVGMGFINVSNVGQVYEDFNKLQPVMPMGVGFKKLVAKKFLVGIEMGARKTFFDYLDGISDGDQRIKDYQYGHPNENDWFFYTGLTFTYVLYKIPCPFPYVPNQSIFSKR